MPPAEAAATLAERQIVLSVPAPLVALKYDAVGDATNRYYEERLKGVGFSAVDFLIADTARLCLVEVKDLRKTDDDEPRLSADPPADVVRARKLHKRYRDRFPNVAVARAKPWLAAEIGRNVRDTLAGLAGAARVADPALCTWAQHLRERPQLAVILLLDAPWPEREYKRIASRLRTGLQQQLAWLGKTCLVDVVRPGEVPDALGWSAIRTPDPPAP